MFLMYTNEALFNFSIDKGSSLIQFHKNALIYMKIKR